MKQNPRRIIALIGIILLLVLYLTTLICAFINTEFANNMLKASIAGTIILPVLLYAMIFLSKAFEKKD